uniref:Uncharacterized protein n=1 Tax=Ciona savignyi TaxID=51511 RepID=H2ZK93_CIOSA
MLHHEDEDARWFPKHELVYASSGVNTQQNIMIVMMLSVLAVVFMKIFS